MHNWREREKEEEKKIQRKKEKEKQKDIQNVSEGCGRRYTEIFQKEKESFKDIQIFLPCVIGTNPMIFGGTKDSNNFGMFTYFDTTCCCFMCSHN